jgi:Spy/CpxP family protein refolding chaperone
MEHDGMLMRFLTPDSKAAKDLGLTEAQSADLRKLIGSTQAGTKESRAQLEKLALKQAELLSQDVPDEAAVMKIVEKLGDLRTQIAKRQMQQLLAAQKILTPEQRTKLREQMKSKAEQLRESKKDGRTPRDAGSRPPPSPPPPANPAIQ